ncbi:hypothetical protein ACHAWO_012153 [Cyclotella atomus]|uniref:Uncharacterized protein n=1 Tax=Cyclotella atomus TaxID=382360 RepID=A0ABD3NQA6_9STRA
MAYNGERMLLRPRKTCRDGKRCRKKSDCKKGGCTVRNESPSDFTCRNGRRCEVVGFAGMDQTARNETIKDRQSTPLLSDFDCIVEID